MATLRNHPNTAASRFFRLSLACVAAVTLSAGAQPAPAEAKPTGAKSQTKRVQRAEHAPAAAKRKSGARHVRVRAAGRKVG